LFIRERVDAPPVGPPGRPLIDAGELMGTMERFPPDELRRLYGTPAGYQRRVDDGIARLVDERWVLTADAERLCEQARSIDF
jgi:hypothetical protein